MTQDRRMALLWTMMLSALALPACEAIGKIFKAGIWTGVIMVGVILLLVLGVVSFMRRA
ncbi:MAG TPA: hypothetical protein VM686_25460 [Polyangiaceae bacterium]|nr:hypothetical protein [Polyangiaceae bacterium]